MTHKMVNQISTMLHLHLAWSMADLAANQDQVEDAEREVESREADQCEDRTALTDDVAGAVARAEEAVDEPWLAAEFRRHPADGVRDEWEREGEHESPQQRARRLQSAPESLQVRECHQQDEGGAETRHDVERVVEKLDVFGPLVLREIVEAADVAVEGAVGEQAERAG